MSRIRSHLPIYACSDNPRTQTRVALFRGVQTLPFGSEDLSLEQVSQRAIKALLQRGIVKVGDHVLITRGDHAHAQGATNTLRVLRVGDEIC
ncbi:Pyruvate kinase II [compost metagenome]